jgi:hypothetical protein
MSISDSSISTDVFTSIRSILVTAAPKVTNTTTSKTKTASINPSYNEKDTTLPQIVINPAGIDEAGFRFSALEGKKFINVTVECYYTNTLGIDQLSDAVKTAVKTACFDGTLTGMDLVGLVEDYAYEKNTLKTQ